MGGVSDAIDALRRLKETARDYPPEVERAVREELIDEQFFAYWEKWARELEGA